MHLRQVRFGMLPRRIANRVATNGLASSSACLAMPSTLSRGPAQIAPMFATVAAQQVRFQADSVIGTDKGTMTVDAVWALWNEGNLFSMNIAQLHAFLQSQSVQFEQGSKKAALIRQVEEFLQKRDSEAKGGSAGGGTKDQYGNWQEGQPQQETLLDLASAGFYENQASMAPKAFQLLVGGNSCDLVVSRVNTTSFPGYPASTECYTLSGAVAELAVRARYSKALQWCVMNIRNLGINGEFCVDFGKIILKDEIIRKNRRIVSGWTLQQRAQLGEPYHWISHVPSGAEADIAAFIAKEEFVPVGERPGIPLHSFETTVKRKKDSVTFDIDPEGKVLAGHESWYAIQRSHMISQIGGQDVRLQLRTRNPLRPQEMDTVRKIKILDISGDVVNSSLPAEMGQVVYTSENRVTIWEKQGANGVVYLLKKIDREPLIITKTEDEDPRVEYSITTTIPNCDLNWFANDLFDLSTRFANVLTPHFVSEFGTEVKPIAFENE